ncbi:MAG: dephospho-CoA kinase [Pseudomonadota bacterium]
MIVIGLTGSIGMGKSTAAKAFKALGAEVWSADDAVHRLYAEGGAGVAALRSVFPEAIVDGAVDRTVLARIVLSDREKLKTLEDIVHPLVGADRRDFLTAAAHKSAPAVVLDIPLLFENAGDEGFDAIVVVSAPAAVQRERVLARPGMSAEKLAAILAEQMPDEEKRAHADYVIETDQPIEETAKKIAAVYEEIIAAKRP